MPSKKLFSQIMGIENSIELECTTKNSNMELGIWYKALTPTSNITLVDCINMNDFIVKAKSFFRDKGFNILTEYNEMWYAISVEAGSVLSVLGYLSDIEIIHESLEESEVKAFLKECEYLIDLTSPKA